MNTTWRIFSASLFVTVFCQIAFAFSTPVAPIFYATNREPDGEGYGRNRAVHGEHGISYALVKVGANGHKFCLQALTREQFLDQVRDAVQMSQAHECCVFIHGYNQDSSDACSHGLRFEEELQEPIIVFDWLSQHRLRGYVQDECNAEWSLRHFELLMHGLESELGSDKQQHNVLPIMVVSHSMGNRLINWYCSSRYDQDKGNPIKYSEVVLTSPDVDRDTFKHYFYKLVANGDQVRLYISKRDKALLGSDVVHGYERAGQSEDQPPLTWTKPGAVAGAETVDFTYLDKGLIGHSIQYGLISSMHKYSTPGNGLTAVTDQKYKSFVQIKPAR